MYQGAGGDLWTLASIHADVPAAFATFTDAEKGAINTMLMLALRYGVGKELLLSGADGIPFEELRGPLSMAALKGKVRKGGRRCADTAKRSSIQVRALVFTEYPFNTTRRLHLLRIYNTASHHLGAVNNDIAMYAGWYMALPAAHSPIPIPVPRANIDIVLPNPPTYTVVYKPDPITIEAIPNPTDRLMVPPRTVPQANNIFQLP